MATWAVCMVNPSEAAGIFSPCGTYRYWLERSISTWKAEKNDPTIRKVMGFSERGGANRTIVVNEFAYIATDIKKLKIAQDPVGPVLQRNVPKPGQDGGGK